MTKILTTLLLLLLNVTVYAGIICPQDITIDCSDDPTDLNFTGKASLNGNHVFFVLKYLDDVQTNACNIGYIDRIWFGDQNSNNQIDAGEPSCTQRITMDGYTGDVTVTFPSDKIYDCQDDITDDAPYWNSGPCDIVGYTVDELEVEFYGDACYKLIRTYTVIDWCIYDPEIDPSAGVWTHTQIIKVLDQTLPEIQNCADITFSLGTNCETDFTLSNVAFDLGTCQSDELKWTINIDLWADGTTDYTYGYFETGEYHLNATSNDQSIQLTLPEKVGNGNHKVFWKVQDACGNVRSCQSKVHSVDNKPPTPYCNLVMHSVVNGAQDTLKLHASSFNLGSYDNCTASDKLKYSFSTLEADSIRNITCSNDGVRFYRIFVKDEAGNKDYCEVYMVVLDNGSCNSRMSATFHTRFMNQNPAADVSYLLKLDGNVLLNGYTNMNGILEIDDISLLENIKVAVNDIPYEAVKPDIFDLIHLQQYFIGNETLTNESLMAADVNGDHKIGIKDIRMLSDYLLGKIDELEIGHDLRYISRQALDNMDYSQLNKEIPIYDIPGFLEVVMIDPGNVSYTDTDHFSGYVEVYWEKNQNGDWDLVSSKDQNFVGVQLEIDGNILEYASSQELEINQSDESLKALLVQNIELKRDDVLLTISGVNDPTTLEVTGMVVDKNLTKKALKIELTTSQSEIITPTFSLNGHYKIVSPDIKVIDIYNASGMPVNFSTNDHQLILNTSESGIFLVKYQEDSSIKNVKILRL
ncbi:MAG TPA: dockerin type I repeat-containing protein [Saprospiraceae bacterium]|nr:dockerin type I repeat-containing protein [Saprospiraceae bacterium]